MTDTLHLFKRHEDGSLEPYEDVEIEAFGGFLPQPGDHIAHTSSWLQDSPSNLFMVITDRFFMRHGRIALVFTFRQATETEYELY